jgi:predicted DNA-binding protein with PD1-like motif
MEYFHGGRGGEIILARFDYDDDLLEGIQKIIDEERITSGVVVSGIGTFYRCVLHMVTTTTYPPVEEFVTIEGATELVSLQGLIAEGRPHLHAMISDTGKGVGGHLEPGSMVLYLAEVCIQRLDDANLTRVPHPELKTMQLKKMGQP